LRASIRPGRRSRARAAAADQVGLMDYFRLHVEKARTGCGWRAFICIDVGRRWAHLCEPATGIRIKVPKEDLRHARPIERPRWSRIAKQLREHGQRTLAKRAKEAARG